MTDFGVLAQETLDGMSVRVLPYWNAGWESLESLGSFVSTGTLSGNVSVNSVPQSSKKVYIYYRTTGKLVGIATTDTNGDWSYNTLDTADLASYFAVCVTDEDFNAIVFDKLTAG